MRKDLAHLVVAVALTLAATTGVSQVKLEVKPKGTNQLELTISPVEKDIYYQILARSNGVTGHWTGLSIECLGSTNPSATLVYDFASGAGNTNLAGLSQQTLSHWVLVVASFKDSDGDGLNDTYEDLFSHTDPFSVGTGSSVGDDGYSDPDGDGWVNIEEAFNGTDPLVPDIPPPPLVEVKSFMVSNSISRIRVALTWDKPRDDQTDYFVVERAIKALRPRPQPMRQTPVVPDHSGTNRPSYQRPKMRPPVSRQMDPWITGPFIPVATVPYRPGLSQYHYVDLEMETNEVPFAEPIYRVRAILVPSLHAVLDRVDVAAIRRTLLPVASSKATNGYVLTVTHAIPYGRYLLLVRDQNDRQWRPAGYFISGTNAAAEVHLHVDSKGMMSEGQRPIAMPVVQFVPEVVEPEFVAGWGEDSDGDGLPDIYEVLVTKTDPAKTDTGSTGEIDGYKDSDGDGWSNLEEFRRRTDPMKKNLPQPVELNHPTLQEFVRAVAVRSDLRYQADVQIRVPGSVDFQTPTQSISMLYYRPGVSDLRNQPGNFDLRITWKVPEAGSGMPGYWR